MDDIYNLNIIIKLAIFIVMWFISTAIACIDHSDRSPIYWRIKIPKILKIFFFGLFTYFTDYDMMGIILQLSNYIYFAIYILGEIIGYQKFYKYELFYPFIIMAAGGCILFFYCAIRGIIRAIIRLNKESSHHTYGKFKLRHMRHMRFTRNKYK